MTTSPSSSFGALLRRLRRAARMTQEQLAECSGVSVRTIRGFETGERTAPRVETVQLLATALGLAPADRDELLAAAVMRTTAASTEIRPRPAPPPELRDAADQLAQAVGARWRHEEEQRQVQDPFPLPVRWRAAPAELTDHWDNILGVPAGAAARPLELTGQLDDVLDGYRRIPSGRLVVLGRAGSGKTILSLRFVLDVLKGRDAGDPVPVIFGLGSWDPTTPLRDWLIAQLLRDYPGLGATGPNRGTLAAALVAADLILPVLDGFDELGPGLHRGALTRLNATTLPLLLTSRPAEYRAAVAGTDTVLTSAAGVELTDLTVTDLANYLPRTTRKAAWDPVLDRLRAADDDPAAARLAEVLRTPLMVSLVRASYSDTPDHDPAALLDTARFGSPAALEHHLLGSFIPSVYRWSGEPAGRWDADRAQRWLGQLAGRLRRQGSRDLAWWRLGDPGQAGTRMLITAAVTALPILVLVWLVAGLQAGPATGLLAGLEVGLVAGPAFGLATGVATRSRGGPAPPSRVQVRWRGGAGRRWLGPTHRFTVGLLAGAVFGVANGVLFGFVNAALSGFTGLWSGMLANAAVYGTLFGLGAGLALGLMAWFEAPVDIGAATSPTGLLQANRAAVRFQLLVFAPVFAIIVGLGGELLVGLFAGPLAGVPLEWSFAGALRFALLSGIGGGVGYALSLTAWGQWLVFARVWLPLTGRLPWSVPAFLDDAYQRGVLRQAGAVYQFRHARLQDHLADADG